MCQEQIVDKKWINLIIFTCLNVLIDKESIKKFILQENMYKFQ